MLQSVRLCKGVYKPCLRVYVELLVIALDLHFQALGVKGFIAVGFRGLGLEGLRL